jgi:hypothetical protein
MYQKKNIGLVMLVVTMLIASSITAANISQNSVNKPDDKIATEKASLGTKIWSPAVNPKPLSENVEKGLKWIIEQQQTNGGWGQGEESASMGNALANLKDQSNVADTCAAALALIRSGSTPSKGPYAKNIQKAVNYICSEIQKSDANSMFITDLRGTRLQTKLGTYIDTFLASMLFAEVTGKMPDAKSEKMLGEAFNKVMDKIEKNQRPDGTFGDTGWANTLSQSLASKGFNRAAQATDLASEQTRERFESGARGKFDKKTGEFRDEGSAGVSLYAGAANLSTMQESDNTDSMQKAELEKKLQQPTTSSEERQEIQQKLDRFEQNANDLQAAKDSIVKKLDDKNFISGFGSNGGEEFLSYMNIGESLVVKGGPEWEKWDKDITANLNRIQNNDGSWTGHHCITGRAFCT